MVPIIEHAVLLDSDLYAVDIDGVAARLAPISELCRARLRSLHFHLDNSIHNNATFSQRLQTALYRRLNPRAESVFCGVAVG